MPNQGFNVFRWKHRAKIGQAVAAIVVARVHGGYQVELDEPFVLSGFLPSQQNMSPGQGVLVRFAGYKNKTPLFQAIYC